MHKPHAALEQAPRREAFLREEVRFLLFVDVIFPSLRSTLKSVESKYMLWLSLEIDRVGRSELHARGEFVTADTRVEPLILCTRSRVRAVEFRHEFLSVALAVVADVVARSVRAEISDGCFGSWINHRAGVLRRQEGGIPVFYTITREAPVVG